MIPGLAEIALVLVLVLIFFGAGKLPQVMATLGEGVKQFRDRQDDDAVDVTPVDEEEG